MLDVVQGRTVRTPPEPNFQPVPIPVVVVGLFCVLQAMGLYFFATYAAEEASYGPPFLFGSLWLGVHGPSIGQAFTTVNLVLAVLLWGAYRVTRTSLPIRSWVLQLSYVCAAILLATLQWACRAVTLSIPRWTITQIYP